MSKPTTDAKDVALIVAAAILYAGDQIAGTITSEIRRQSGEEDGDYHFWTLEECHGLVYESLIQQKKGSLKR